MAAGTFWPWWATAAALAAITVGFWLAIRRPLGVSGILGRFASLGEERAAERQAAALAGDAGLEAALLAATREAFGDAAPASAASGGAIAEEAARLGPRPTLAMHALFLGGIVLGGALAGLTMGAPPSLTLGPAFEALVGTGWRGAAALVAGGALVGFGTTLSGGCASGHGLSGCSRLQPGSLLATAVFFGVAVGTSFLLITGAG